MFRENIIEFSASDIYTSLKQDYPVPTKVNIPTWYKDLKHAIELPTIKGCVPFLETLTTGYLLKIPQDIKIYFNVINPQTNQPDVFLKINNRTSGEIAMAYGLNFIQPGELGHPPRQLEGCPYINTNKNLSFVKIINPWIIKTPPGYSCLFLPPLNNTDDRFFIIPGIVHTDQFPVEVNFPIVINGDKYPTLETVLERGTPYVQVIPFKRESWKMKITSLDIKEKRKGILLQSLSMFNVYKKIFWDKVSWK
jgi:hypothetical protein